MVCVEMKTVGGIQPKLKAFKAVSKAPMAIGSLKQAPVKFSGTLEELQEEFKRLEEEKKFNLLNQQCEKSNKLLTEKLIKSSS